MSLIDEIKSALVGPKQLRFNGQETFFQGHFPEAPVLPAFVQLRAVRLLVESELSGPIEVLEVSRAVFKSRAEPEKLLEFEIKIDGDKAKAEISCEGIDISLFNFRFQRVESRA
ncbi:MAG: hypothetical protein V3V10_07455 [Planctomycetota bacterium]